MSRRRRLITFTAEWDFGSTRCVHLTDRPNRQRYAAIYDQRTLQPITVKARSMEEAKRIFREKLEWRVYELR